MSKKCYRFFGGLLNTQEKWLNKMSEKGYRLVRTQIFENPWRFLLPFLAKRPVPL